MPVDGGGDVQMIPLWVQWLFGIGGAGLIVVVFVALWSRLGKIEKLIRNYPYQAAWVQATHHPRREPS